MAEDGEVYAWKHLMVEAGVSPGLRRFHEILWYVLLLLLVVSVPVIVVGIFVGPMMLAIAIILFVSTVVLMVAATVHRRQLIEHVRWLEGTVTFHAVEPGGTGENGQWVVCRVTTHPPTDITTVGTMIGPMDAQLLVVGATMRCLIDRNDGFNPLHVFPYAGPDTALPWGRVLKFDKA